MTELRKPALFVDVFTPIEAGSQALRRRWEALGGLDMSSPVDGLPVPLTLSDVPTEPVPEFSLLAARTRVSEAGQYQAYAYAYYDMAGMVACLAPPEEQAFSWHRLLAQWDAVEPPAHDDEMLSTASVLVGLVEAGAEPTEPPAVPGRSWGAAFRTDRGLIVWEAPGDPRLLAIVGPPDREEEIDRWAWWAGETRLPRLTLYLLHAAKLRLEAHVYRAQIGDFRTAQRVLDEELLSLTGLLAHEGRRPLTTERLYEAQRRLITAVTRAAGVAGSTTSLEDLRRTVAIARENMRGLLPVGPHGELDGSPFTSDLALAEWLDAQVEHDTGYATATRERANHIKDLLALRLSHATERRIQEQNYLLLLQTALLSALIAGFAALDVLDLKTRLHSVPAGLRPPLVAVVMSLALALPPLLVHLYARYRWFDRVAAALLGGSVGWLVASLAWRHGGTGARPVQAIILASTLGGATLWLTWLQDRKVHAAERREDEVAGHAGT